MLGAEILNLAAFQEEKRERKKIGMRNFICFICTPELEFFKQDVYDQLKLWNELH